MPLPLTINRSWLLARESGERWITIHGTHVKIDGKGTIVDGSPKIMAALKGRHHQEVANQPRYRHAVTGDESRPHHVIDTHTGETVSKHRFEESAKGSAKEENQYLADKAKKDKEESAAQIDARHAKAAEPVKPAAKADYANDEHYRVEKVAPKPAAKAEPKPQAKSVEDHVRAAHAAINKLSGGATDRGVSIGDVRKEMPGVSREDQDKAIRHLAENGYATLIPVSTGPQDKRLSDESQALTLPSGGKRHVVYQRGKELRLSRLSPAWLALCRGDTQCTACADDEAYEPDYSQLPEDWEDGQEYLALSRHSYSSTQIPLDPDMAAKVLALSHEIDDDDLADDGRETDPHVTVKYGLHTQSPDAVRKVLANPGRGESFNRPVKLKLGKVSMFPASDDRASDVVKIDVAGDNLHALHHRLSGSLANTTTHSTYQPHVTLAYVKPGKGKKYLDKLNKLEGQESNADRMTFSDQDGMKTDIALPPHDGRISLDRGGENCGTGAGGFSAGNTCGGNRYGKESGVSTSKTTLGNLKGANAQKTREYTDSKGRHVEEHRTSDGRLFHSVGEKAGGTRKYYQVHGPAKKPKAKESGPVSWKSGSGKSISVSVRDSGDLDVSVDGKHLGISSSISEAGSIKNGGKQLQASGMSHGIHAGGALVGIPPEAAAKIKAAQSKKLESSKEELRGSSLVSKRDLEKRKQFRDNFGSPTDKSVHSPGQKIGEHVTGDDLDFGMDAMKSAGTEDRKGTTRSPDEQARMDEAGKAAHRKNAEAKVQRGGTEPDITSRMAAVRKKEAWEKAKADSMASGEYTKKAGRQGAIRTSGLSEKDLKKVGALDDIMEAGNRTVDETGQFPAHLAGKAIRNTFVAGNSSGVSDAIKSFGDGATTFKKHWDSIRGEQSATQEREVESHHSAAKSAPTPASLVRNATLGSTGSHNITEQPDGSVKMSSQYSVGKGISTDVHAAATDLKSKGFDVKPVEGSSDAYHVRATPDAIAAHHEAVGKAKESERVKAAQRKHDALEHRRKGYAEERHRTATIKHEKASEALAVAKAKEDHARKQKIIAEMRANPEAVHRMNEADKRFRSQFLSREWLLDRTGAAGKWREVDGHPVHFNSEDEPDKGSPAIVEKLSDAHREKFKNDGGYNDSEIDDLEKNGPESKHWENVVSDDEADDPEEVKALKAIHSPERVTKSEAFKGWFGDWEKDPSNASKIVTKDGKPEEQIGWAGRGIPVKFHHGTDKKFSAFNEGWAFFSPSEKYAKNYGDDVSTFYLNARKPIDLRGLPGDGDVDPEKVSKSLARHGLDIPASKLGKGEIHQVLQPARDEIRKQALAKGYDSLIQNENYAGMGSQAVAVFNPEQVKSTKNKGTFNPKEKDFNLSRPRLISLTWLAAKRASPASEPIDLYFSLDRSPMKEVPLGLSGFPLEERYKVGNEEVVVPLSYWEKDVLKAGDFEHTGTRRKFQVTRKDLDSIVTNFSRMKAEGVRVPLTKKHKVHANDEVESVGEILSMWRDGDTLKARHVVKGKDNAELANVSDSSVGLHLDWKNDKGHRFGAVVDHNSLTPFPVLAGLGYFRPMAA